MAPMLDGRKTELIVGPSRLERYTPVGDGLKRRTTLALQGCEDGHVLSVIPLRLPDTEF